MDTQDPAAAVSLGALLRWVWLCVFPCYDTPDFKRGRAIREAHSFSRKGAAPWLSRACQSSHHRCCWLCCAMVGPVLAMLASALYLFYTKYLPMVSVPHPPLYDTDGNKIDAHGGQIIRHEGAFYWYGESRKGLSAMGYPVGVNEGWTNEGVNCYRSSDMLAWEFAGMVFRNSSVALGADQPGPYVIERPKVVYNAATSTFVLWMHLDSFSYTYRYAGVATSPSPVGPFEWKHALHPNGHESFDLQIWREPGTEDAYLLRDTDGHAWTMVSRLTADYTGVEEEVSSRLKGPCEGIALFKDLPGDGLHYLVCSYATWYYPNAMQLHRKAGGLAGGEWEFLGDIGDGLYSRLSYNSQPTFVLPLRNATSGELVPVYMGDNWNANGPGGVGNASYLWLPFERCAEESCWWDWRPWRLPWQEAWMPRQVERGADMTDWLY